ncbi:hypothetical protein R6Q59_025162 [Mikania micrantha]
MNHTNSYNAAGISSVNSAFISQPSFAYPVHKVVLSLASSVLSSTLRFLKCSIALGSGDLFPPFAVVGSELEKIHPEDMEEMDITWHIANAFFRAKNFTKTTGRNPWGQSNINKVNFTKEKCRCFTCHEPSHYARECTKPVNGATDGENKANDNKALVVMKNGVFGWDD